MSRPRRALVCFGAAFALAFGCTQVGTNPDVPVAIQLFPPPSPATIVGDTMRDSTGAAVPLRVLVFNSANDSIPGAPVRFLALDSTGRLTLDTATGTVVANDTGQVAVVAQVGSLQSTPDTIVVVDTPSVMLAVDPALDTLVYTFSTRDTLLPLRVRLLHLPDSAAIRHYQVRYAFVYPQSYDNADTTKAQLVSASRVASAVDTTDATGGTNRYLRVAPFTLPLSDSVILDVTAVGPGGGVVAGGPVRYIVHLRIQ